MNIHWKSACLVFIYISSRCTGAPLVRNVVSDLSAADVWSSDGQWILYVKRDAEGHPQIWKLGLTSLKEVQITADPFSHAKPAWSFDGQWVCYERSDEGGFQQVCKTLSGGGQEIPVTSGQWDHCSPKWSPRDDWILLIRTDREGRTQLCKIDAEGKRMVRLTKGTGRKEGACWSPDGRWILYGAKGDNGFISLKRISSEGGEEMDVSGTEGAAGGWDWSPDGRWVVWCRRSKEEGTALLKTPVQGGDSILLSRDCMDASAPSWSPDGKWIVFVRKISVPEKASCVRRKRAFYRGTFLMPFHRLGRRMDSWSHSFPPRMLANLFALLAPTESARARLWSKGRLSRKILLPVAYRPLHRPLRSSPYPHIRPPANQQEDLSPPRFLRVSPWTKKRVHQNLRLQ